MGSVSIDGPASAPPSSLPPLGGSAPSESPTDRLVLARAIEAAVLAVPGVVELIGDVPGASAGAGTWTTRGHVGGVRVVADDDRFAVDLALRAELVDLMGLGDDVRSAALAAARASGFGGAIGAISIRIADVIEPAGGAA